MPIVDLGTSNYLLAFLAEKASSHETTAKFGWDDGNEFTLCNSGVNPFNYGYFNASVGYVIDAVPGTNSAPSGYPSRVGVDSIQLTNADNELDVTSLTDVSFQLSGDPL